MKLVEIIWNPTRRQLRQFGVTCLVALPLLGWMWGGSASLVGWLGLMGFVLAVAGWAAPQAVKPIFLALSVVALPIGRVVSELALLLIYFGIFLPFGLVFRLTGRDALHRKFDRKADSYWQPRKQPSGPASYYRQS